MEYIVSLGKFDRLSVLLAAVRITSYKFPKNDYVRCGENL